MVKLANTLSRLKRVKVLVLGDLLLDTYTFGKVRRISPEAPVAVVHVQKEEYRPGGSGNVALNLASLGAEVVLVGRVGKDRGGEQLCQALQTEGLMTQWVVAQDPYCTPVKNRVIADNQQVVRVDYEQVIPLSEPLEQMIIESLPYLLEGIKVVALSDYGKGFLTPTLISAVIHYAREQGILIITDPKGQDFSKYQGTTIIKPNLGEAYAAVGLTPQASLDLAARKVLEISQADLLMVTRSEAGISLFHRSGDRQDFPVHVRQVKDVTGAGDTVLAMLAYALANELSYEEAAQLCNIAAGIAIEQVGCARVSLGDLAQRLLEQNVGNKVFDEDHLFALQEVLNRQPFQLLALSQLKFLSLELFQTIRELSDQARLLVYVADAEPEDAMIALLSSLKEVSFILVHRDSLKALCEAVKPSKSYLLVNDEIRQIAKWDEILDSFALRPSLSS